MTQATLTEERSSHVGAKDGTLLHVQDWGTGRPVLFVAAWALNSNFWGAAMMATLAAGLRTVAYDRRGHGRSDAPSHGYDVNTLADDLAAILEARQLRDVVIVAHSMGTCEVVRYLTRHGTDRISKLLFVAPTTPYLVKTADNPEGVPVELLEASLTAIAADYPRWIADNEAPFFTSETDSETRAWIKAMMAEVPLPIAISFRRQAGRTDYRSDLAAIDKPLLVIHGDKDASAPLHLTGERTAKAVSGARLLVYNGAPHALPLTHRARFHQDMLAFAQRG